MAFTTSLTVIVIVAIFGVALLIYLFIRNQKDKKETFPPGKSDDKTEEFRLEQDQKKDRI